MKVLFMGTPAFASKVLEALSVGPHTVVAVVTQPDRALKRGKTEETPVKKLAVSLGIPVFQPEKLKNEICELKKFDADIAVTAAYGQILNSDVLNAFKNGVINVHASLLPKYRGASPIYAAIKNGESETGVTIMRTELGLDTGPMLSTVKTPITEYDTAETLEKRLAELGARLLTETLDRFGEIVPIPQNDALATKCGIIKKEETFIDFTVDAKDAALAVRALSSKPCAKAVIDGETYKIYFARAVNGSGAPGEIIECGERLVIACGNGALEITSIQAPGKNRLDIKDFLRGRKFKAGTVCGS